MLRFAFLLSALIPVAAHAAAKAPPRVGWSADSTLFVSAPKETPFDFARLTSLPMDVQMENPETRALLDLYLNGKTTEDNRARLLINGSNSFAARFELLNGAKKSIYFQTMYWLPDNYGLKLLPIIARKLEEGVVIRIVIDSLSTPAKDFTFYRNVNDYIRSKYRELAPKFPQFADELAKTSKSIWVFKASETGFPAQVIQHDEKGKTLRVVEHFFEDSSMLHIMHHKAIIVDGEKVITGGMNFADNYAYGGKGIHGKKNKRSVKIEDGPEYSDEEIATIRAMLPNYWVNISQHMGEKLKEGRFDPELGWRDTDIYLEGPITQEYTRSFLKFWQYAVLRGHDGMDKSIPWDIDTTPFTPKSKIILAKDYLDNGGITSADHLLMRKVEHKPQLGETYILRQLRWALASAKQYVICETPYLVLPKVAQDWVIDAATRAQNPVPVYFITNSPESNDTGPSMSWAARRIAVRMMEATRGHVSYNEWHNPTIHSKVCLADDYWVSIGTSNYDNNSATLSTEIVVGVFDHAFAGIVRAMFAQDLALSHQATYEDVQQWKSQLREQIDFGGDPDGTALMTEGMIQNLVIPFLRDGVGEERRAFMTY